MAGSTTARGRSSRPWNGGSGARTSRRRKRPGGRPPAFLSFEVKQEFPRGVGVGLGSMKVFADPQLQADRGKRVVAEPAGAAREPERVDNRIAGAFPPGPARFGPQEEGVAGGGVEDGDGGPG